MNYLIHAGRHGCVGGIGFAAGCWHQQSRDRHIGWSDRAWVANLDLVVNIRRFLILPSVRVRGPASHVVGLASADIADDREVAYGA